MILQKCKICGKLFEARNSRHITCSSECRRVNGIMLNKIYRQDPVIRQKENLRQKEWHRKHAKIIPCKFCGEPVEAEFNGFVMIRKTYHEDCMLKKAYEAIRNGEKTYGGVLKFASNKGFSKSEILEIMEEQK